MELDSAINYLYNLINSSLQNLKTTNEINQNICPISPPFYASYLKNQREQLARNHPVSLTEPKSIPTTRKKVRSAETAAQHNTSNLKDLLQPTQNNQLKDSDNNLQQTIKCQNLNNILNKIQVLKKLDHARHKLPNMQKIQSGNVNAKMRYQDHFVQIQRHPNQSMNLQDSRNFKIQSDMSARNEINSNAVQTNNETPNGKTVRQLLEERQSYLDKLRQNRMEIFCKRQSEPTHSHNSHSNIRIAQFHRKLAPKQQIPEMIDIEISKKRDKVCFKSSQTSHFKSHKDIEPTQVAPKPPMDSSIHQSNLNYNSVGYYESQPKKSLTVRELLETRRNIPLNNQNHLDKTPKTKRRRNHQAIFHPYLESRECISNINNVIRRTTILDGPGLDSNNPIVLSDEETEVTPIKRVYSSENTEYNNFSEIHGHPSNYYELYSEHNYVLDPNLVIRANQVINDLNQELNIIKSNPIDSKHEIIDKIDKNSDEERARSLKDIMNSHESCKEQDFIKSLNLIKSRDLKRIPIAYLNAKYPANDISKAVYAGLETKNAVLDFPRSPTQLINKKGPRSQSKQKLLDYHNKHLSGYKKKISNDWSQVLQNLDFSSPLSQKIIKIFPEYHSKRLKKKALKVKFQAALVQFEN